MISNAAFLLNNANLTWSDILWGLRRCLVDWPILVEIAGIRVAAGSDDLLVNDLARLGNEGVWKARQIVEQLAMRDEKAKDKDVRGKWLFLALLWSFETRRSIDDGLAKVEEIYADFDYPDEVRSFVRYMPADAEYLSSVKTRDDALERLMVEWRNYLEASRQRFGR